MLISQIFDSFEEIEIGKDVLTNDVNLKYDLGMDSQEIIELHCALEKRFQIKLPDVMVKDSITFGDLVQRLKSYLESC